MPFDITEIISELNRHGGVAKSNAFSLMITPPKWSGSQNEPRLIQMMCDNAQLPGLTFATNDVKNLGYGPTFKLPHTPIYNDLETTIMCDGNGEIIKFFHRWAQNIININSNGAPSTSGYNDAKMYSVQYPSNYITTISLTLYNKDSSEIIVYTMNEAYPLRIGQPALDWSATNNILRLPITFTFRTWTANSFYLNDQTLENGVSTFNPFARTLSGSLFDVSTNSSIDLETILRNNVISLVNGKIENVLKIFM